MSWKTTSLMGWLDVFRIFQKFLGISEEEILESCNKVNFNFETIDFTYLDDTIIATSNNIKFIYDEQADLYYRLFVDGAC